MNCPKCKSIIKEGNVSCQVCGWSEVNSDTVIQWEFVHGQDDIRRTIIKDTVVAILTLSILNAGAYFIVFGMTEWMPVALALSFFSIVMVVILFYEDRTYFHRHHYKYIISELDLTINDQNIKKQYAWNKVNHIKPGLNWWGKTDKIFVYIDESEKNYITIHLPKDKDQNIKILTMFRKISQNLELKLQKINKYDKKTVIILIIIAILFLYLITILIIGKFSR